MKIPSIFLPFLLAAVWTGLNALKPPVIDDTAYLALARHISNSPTDPYGFEQFWYQVPEPANHVLAPPVFPYWLGLGMRLFGENVVLLKLWLFPFAALFTFALQALLKRFAPTMEAPTLVAAVLSPALLPAFNFFLDVPALALSLSAVTIFLRALDKQSFGLAVLAGLTAALASQTKYTGLLAAPLLLGISVLRRRPLPGFVAVLLAVSLFTSWELFIRARYGESHFWFGAQQSDASWLRKFNLFSAALPLLGGIASGVMFLGIVALGLRRPWLVVAALGLACGFAILAVVPDTRKSYWVPLAERQGIGGLALLLGGYGWGVVTVTLAVMIRQLCHWPGAGEKLRLRRLSDAPDVFILLFWLAVEVAGYYVLTPFPASRRLMGATIVAYLLVARLASHTFRGTEGRRLAWSAAICGAALGAFYAAIDIFDARLEPDAVREAAAFIRARDDRPTIWFTGHWGLQYEATRQGFQPLVPGQSHLHAGDWLVVPPSWQPQQEFVADARQRAAVHVVQLDRHFRLRTLPPYYGGQHTIEWWPNPMYELKIYRINSDWRPAAP